MDEGWDMWTTAKNPYDYAARFLENYERDIRSMVRKDYNHPCVVLYSIGNEVTEPAEPSGVALAGKLVDGFHALDATRPVTGGINIALLLMAHMGMSPFGGGESAAAQEETEQVPSQAETAAPHQTAPRIDSTEFNRQASEQGPRMVRAAASDEADAVSSPVLDLLDIAGYNYASSRYPVEGEKHPDRVVVGSETFPQDLAENWRMVEQYPYLIGDFMWTAWDYLGEAGVGAWTYEADGANFIKPYPWLLADSGAFDILGHDNAEAVTALPRCRGNHSGSAQGSDGPSGTGGGQSA